MNAAPEQGRIVQARRFAARVCNLGIASEALRGYAFPAGAEVSVRVAAVNDDAEERRYSVWRSDARVGCFELCVTLHGLGPGSRWAERVEVGDAVAFQRSRAVPITLDARADTHLFLGDETSVASAEALARVLPAGARMSACFEVLTADDRWPDAELGHPSRIGWIVRSGRPGAALLAWLESGDDALTPDTAAYITGEAWLCAMVHAHLIKSRGLSPERVHALPYWKHRALRGTGFQS